MAKYQSILDNPHRIRAMTGLTVDEFGMLVPFFHEAFENHMQYYTLDGYQRDGRRYVPYSNTPLPTPEDKLLFILTYLKQNAIQEVQGQLFEMSQSNVSKWTQLLHVVLNRALEQQALLPARDAATLTARLCMDSDTVLDSPTFFFKTGPNDL